MDWRVSITISLLTLSVLTLQIRFYFLTLPSAFVLILIIALAAIVVLCAFNVGSSRSVLIGVPLLVALAFVIRSVPVLIDILPPSSDGWRLRYVLDAFIQAQQTGSLTGARYWGTELQTAWPAYYILTAILRAITGASTRAIWMWMPPLIGALGITTLFFGGYRMAGQRTGLVAAALGTGLSSMVYYSSEWHPQGFVIILMPLFIGLLTVRAVTSRNRWLVLWGVILLTLMFSHNFTSLYLLPFLVGTSIIANAILLGRSAVFKDVDPQPVLSGALVLVATICILTIHVFLSPLGIRSFTSVLITALKSSAPVKGTQTVGEAISPFLFLNYLSKGIITTAGSVVGIMILYRGGRSRVVLAASAVSLATWAAGALIIPRLPLNRLIGLFLITAVLLAAMLSRTLSDRSVMIAFICLVTAAAVLPLLSVYPPVSWTGVEHEDPEFTHNNLDITMVEYVAAGKWSRQLPNDKVLNLPKDAKSIVFYYSGHKWSYLTEPGEYRSTWPPSGEVVVSTRAGGHSLSPAGDKIYSSGNVSFHGTV